MIHTNRIVTVGEQECIIDRPIVLYRGDREVEIEFTLVGNEFMFSEDGNVIKSVNASHGQLVLNTPSGEHMFSELAECHEGKVVFVVTKEMIDEFIEMGFYSFQIRLYDSAEMKSRVTIPPVMNGFDIRNPIAAEDETNVVDQGIVDYARIFKDQSNEELPTFTWDGEYVKTEWAHHDVITENKLNKIEDALYSINANIKESDVVMLNALDNVKKDADAYVKEHMAEVEADVDEFERNLNTDVQKFKVDTNAAMTAHKNEVGEVISGEIESINSQLAHIKNFSTPEMFGAIGDGIADDTDAIKQAINNSNTVIFRGDKSYNISQIIIKKDCIIEGNGATINQISENECIISQGNYKTVTTLTNNAERYNDVITLSSYDNISVGDILVMRSSKLWYHDNRDSLYKGETHKVVKVSSDGITIEPSLQDSYDITTETVTCSFFTPITVDINNLNIIGNMYIKQNINTVVKNCRVKPVNKSNAICLSSSYNTTFDNCVITDCDVTDTGYAIQDNSSTYTKVLNCKFNNNRRGVDFSGNIPARLGLVENCIVSNPVEVIEPINTSAFGTHGPADSIVFRNNNITNCRQAFIIRGSYCVIENNNLYGRILYGVVFTAGDNIVIRGNKYFAQDNNKDKINANLDNWRYLAFLLYVDHNPTSITIEDNHLEALRSALVVLNDNVGKLIIRRNSVDNYTFKSGFIVIDSSVPSSIENLEYTYNNLKFKTNQYQLVSENINYNINYLICTDFPISPSLNVWGGDGTVTDNGTDLRITILPCDKKDGSTKYVNLVGTLKFTVEESEVALRLEPLVYSSRITSEAFLYISQNFSQGVLKFLESNKLYISSKTENYNGKFSVGSHAININISYLR